MKKIILTTSLLSAVLFIVGCKKNETIQKAFNENSTLLNMPFSFFFDDDTIPSHGLISFYQQNMVLIILLLFYLFTILMLIFLRMKTNFHQTELKSVC